jgi:hypothetical protein
MAVQRRLANSTNEQDTLGLDGGIQPARNEQGEEVIEENVEGGENSSIRKPKTEQGWRKIVRNFTPS